MMELMHINNCTLQTLNLFRTGIADDGATVLAEALKHNSSFQKLNLLYISSLVLQLYSWPSTTILPCRSLIWNPILFLALL